MTSTMRPFGMISTSIWQSERFCSLKSHDTRLAYIWLHTSAKTCAGALRVGPAHLFEEVDYVGSLDRAEDIFAELHCADLVDWNRPYVVIPKYLKFNPVKTYRHAIGAFKEVLALPECEAKTKLMQELQKQKGSMELVNWRNISGDPHDVVFLVHQYFEDTVVTPTKPDRDPMLTPSEPHQDPIRTPSGKTKNTNKKEKGKWRTEAAPDIVKPQAPQQAGKSELLRNKANLTAGRETGPRPETLRSALARGSNV